MVFAVIICCELCFFVFPPRHQFQENGTSLMLEMKSAEGGRLTSRQVFIVTTETIHLQPIPADRAGPANLYQHRQDCYHGAASLQRRQAAIQPRTPDDPCAQNALFPISVSNFRLATAAADLEYLRQFDGLAQFGEYGKGGRSLLPASERAELPPT